MVGNATTCVVESDWSTANRRNSRANCLISWLHCLMYIDWQVCTEVTSDSASFDLVLEVDSGTDAMCSEHEVSRAENTGTFRIIGDDNRLHTHTHVTMQPMKQHSRGREMLCTVLLMRFVLTFDSGWKRQRFSARGQNFFILFCPETVNPLS